MPSPLVRHRCLITALDKPQALRFVQWARELEDARALDIIINARGGSITIALGLLHFLESFPDLEVTTYNMEHCDSAAVLLFLAGGRRICRQDATFFLHSLQISVLRRQTINTLRRELRTLRRETARVISELCRKTALSEGQWRRMLSDAGTHLDASAALRAGLVTEIAAPSLDWRPFAVF